METKISTKLGYVQTDGWRGYEQPIYAVGGANDTGNWEDSPCPSNVRAREIKGFTKLLRQAAIPYKLKWCRSANVFCAHRYVIVSEADHAKAYVIAKDYQLKSGIRLFYACKIISEKGKNFSTVQK